MTADPAADGALSRWYRNRVGEASTSDEVRGYWLFVLGIVLGVLGILLFLPSTTASPLRQWSIAIAAAGLSLVFVGPTIRLPLERRSTQLGYLGLAICGVAILWFLLAFPGNWTPRAGQPRIIGLYSLGLLVIGLGGVAVPLSTAAAEENAAAEAEAEAEREALRAEIEELRDALEAAEASNEAADASATEATETIEQLEAGLADAEADEADLAERLRDLRASRATFELYEDSAGEYRWRLRHDNGNLIASSGEGYTRRHNAQKGMQSVRRNALGATVLHVETEADLSSPDDEFTPIDEAESRATFEFYEDNAGEYRWRLRHENGNLIADSSEGYASRGNAQHSIDRLREYVGPADYLQFDPTGFEVYRDSAGEWRWRLVHRNGNILADSGEGYTRRRNAYRAIEAIRERLGEMTFEVDEDSAGEYRWRLRAKNGEIMADSGEGYADRRGAEEAVDRAREYVPDADLLDIGRAAFELYEDNAGEYRWRLRHRNGNILADSGEGYVDWSGCRDGVESVKRNAPNAEIEDVD